MEAIAIVLILLWAYSVYNNKCWFGHKWAEWQNRGMIPMQMIVRGAPVGMGVKERLTRTCCRCGKMEEDLI